MGEIEARKRKVRDFLFSPSSEKIAIQRSEVRGKGGNFRVINWANSLLLLLSFFPPPQCQGYRAKDKRHKPLAVSQI